MAQRLRDVWSQMRGPGFWWAVGGSGLFMLGATGLVATVNDALDDREDATTTHELRVEVDDLRAEIDCRNTLEEQQRGTSGLILVELALGLASFAEGNDDELTQHTAETRRLAAELAAQAAAAGDAAITCGMDPRPVG